MLPPEILPSPEDPRDFKYQAKSTALADKVDLRAWAGLVENQGNLGSCTGSAMSDAYELSVKMKYPDRWTELSKLFVYYNSRVFDDTLEEDQGSYLRDTLKAVKKFGICKEDIWPYEISRFNQQPTPRAYVDAQTRTVTVYENLYNNREMMEVLNSRRPVIIGMTIFSGFDDLDKDNSVVAMPRVTDTSTGNHALCLVGYDLPQKKFLAKNSYGVNWGDSGYCWIPFDYLDLYCFDRWCFDISDYVI